MVERVRITPSRSKERQTVLRKEQYSKVPRALRRFAQDIFGIPVSEATMRAWQILSEASHDIDSHADSGLGKKERLEFEQSFLQFLAGEAESPPVKDMVSVINLRKSIEDLPKESQERFIRTSDALFFVTETLKQTSVPKTFWRLTRLEGKLFSDLFLELLPVEVVEHNRYEDFRRFVNRAGKVGNVIDSVIDMKEDYTAGQTVIRPTLTNRTARPLLQNFTDVLSVVTRIRPGFVLRLLDVATQDRRG